MASVTDNTGTLCMTVGTVIIYAAKSVCTVSEDGTNVSVRYSSTQQFVYPATAFTAPSGTAAAIAAAIAAMITNAGGGGGTVTTATSGITAYAPGGQANATACTSAYNYVDTVAAANASVKALSATSGRFQYFQNNGANDMNLYPQTGDAFTGQAANAPISIPPGGGLTIVCAVAGTFRYF